MICKVAATSITVASQQCTTQATHADALMLLSVSCSTTTCATRSDVSCLHKHVLCMTSNRSGGRKSSVTGGSGAQGSSSTGSGTSAVGSAFATVAAVKLPIAPESIVLAISCRAGKAMQTATLTVAYRSVLALYTNQTLVDYS
jgi:hypothetical protein